MSDGREAEMALGNEAIGRLLVRMSAPAAIAMLVTALYNVVDTIFVGRGVGALAIGGLTVAFPLQMMIMALAMMVGIGAASVVSRSLGAGQRQRATRAAGNAMVMALLLGALLVAVGYLFMTPLLRVFGATETLMPYAVDYLQVVLIGSVFFSYTVASNNLIRAEGRTRTAMTVMLIGAVSNMILDPVFIFGLKMGIRGAALATVISQVASFLFVVHHYFVGRRSSLGLAPRDFRLERNVVREIATVGFPSLVRQAAGSVLAVVVNNALRTYGAGTGDLHIAAFGIVNRVMVFVGMPLFGIAQGLQPIVGYNFGAGLIPRVRHAVSVALRASIVLSSAYFVVLMIFPGAVVRIFTDEPKLVEIGRTALRIVLIMAPLIGINIVGSTYFQAVGRAFPALVLSLSRQVILLLPLVVLLPRFLGVQGVWISFAVADFLSTILTAAWLAHAMRRVDGAVAEVGSS